MNSFSYKHSLAPHIKFLVFVAVVLTFFIRPFALGLNNSLLTNALMLGVAVLISISTQATMYNRKQNLLLVLSIYLLFALYNSISRESIGKSFLPVLQVATVFLLFRNYSVMRLYFKYLKNIFLLLIILAIVNFALELFYGDREKLALISDIVYLNGTYEFSLYFPLTWSKMGWDLVGDFLFAGTHSRQYFFFIEPGMVPPFFTAFIYMVWNDESEKRKWLQTALFIVGILMTFSTGGPLIMLLSVPVWYLSKNRSKLSIFTIVLVAVGLYVAWYAYNYMPFFGRMAKLDVSAGAAESIETHESFGVYILVGVGLIAFWGLLSIKTKHNTVLPIVFASIIALGYMSNYIGFTFLATTLLFWDDAPQVKRIPVTKNTPIPNTR